MDALSDASFDSLKQDLSHKLLATKDPAQFLLTLIYSIPVLANIRICIETGIFTHLTNAESLTAAELADKLPGTEITRLNDADVTARRDFIIRVLRPVCAINLIDECGVTAYRANALTRALADPGLAAGFMLVFDNAMGPQSTMREMLNHAQYRDYRAPTSALDGPWQKARGTEGMSTFESWVRDDPTQMERLSLYMDGQQRKVVHWTEWFPERALFGDHRETERVLLVDVGGGYGHDVAAFAAKYPKNPGALVVQDQAGVLEEARIRREESGHVLDPRITFMEHDFFAPQPVKHASIYYMHMIMHDWPDTECVEILAHLRDAMAADSRILINDVILPVKDCPLFPAAFDMTMWALHSGMERDEEQWERLIASVGGLEVVRFWHPPGKEGQGIVEVVRC